MGSEMCIRDSINTETEWEALKVRFDEGLRTDAEQRSRFNDLLKTYSIYLQESLNRDTSPLPNESDHGTQDQT